MHVDRFSGPEPFLQVAEPFLLRAEAENNFMLGLRDIGNMFGADAYLAAVVEGRHVAAFLSWRAGAQVPDTTGR